MNFHDLALILLAFISELIGTISGFGSSTFFVPLAVFFEKFQLVLVLTAILHCFGNISRILIFKKDFDFKSFSTLAVPAIVFTGLGAVLTTQLPTDLLLKVLGIVLIGISLILLFRTQVKNSIPKWFAIILSIASGFFTGFVGTGGALRGLALTALHLPKNSFIMTSASVDIGGDLLRAFIYLQSGYMDWDQWLYIPFLGIAALVGSQIGKRVIDRLNQNQFDKIVAFFIFMSGCLLLVNK